MKPNNIYIVANLREEFKNQFLLSEKIYNDHPSQKSILFAVKQICSLGYVAEYFGGVNELIRAYEQKQTFPPYTLFLNFSDGLEHASRKAQSAILLELLNLPFAGSDACSRLIAGNKQFAKEILNNINIFSPKGFLIHRLEDLKRVSSLSYPLIIKPNREGSSIGITQKNFITNPKELLNITEQLLGNFKELLVEEYISGYEITNFVIGNPDHFLFNDIILNGYKNEFYFENFIFGIEEKSGGKRNQIIPEELLPPEIISKIKRTSEVIFEYLGMRDFTRIDYRLTKSGELYFIELNGNPVISETSEMGTLCKFRNIPFRYIYDYIISSATYRIWERT